MYIPLSLQSSILELVIDFYYAESGFCCHIQPSQLLSCSYIFFNNQYSMFNQHSRNNQYFFKKWYSIQFLKNQYSVLKIYKNQYSSVLGMAEYHYCISFLFFSEVNNCLAFSFAPITDSSQTFLQSCSTVLLKVSKVSNPSGAALVCFVFCFRGDSLRGVCLVFLYLGLFPNSYHPTCLFSVFPSPFTYLGSPVSCILSLLLFYLPHFLQGHPPGVFKDGAAAESMV